MPQAGEACGRAGGAAGSGGHTRREVTVVIALLLLLQASPSPAAPMAVAVRADIKAADPADKMVCHTDNATGHLIATRVCHTRREWTQMERNGQEAMIQHSGCVPGASCK